MERTKNFNGFLEECKLEEMHQKLKLSVPEGVSVSTGSNYTDGKTYVTYTVPRNRTATATISDVSVGMDALPKKVKENIFIKEEKVLLEAMAPLIDNLYKKEVETFIEAVDKERKKEIKKTCDTAIRNVYFNAKAGTTVVMWKDGGKTIVRCQNGEKFDYEKGLAMAIAKHYMGGDTPYYNEVFKKWVPKEED